jgi:hypothetical protein
VKAGARRAGVVVILACAWAACDPSGTVNNGHVGLPATTLRVTLNDRDEEGDRGGAGGLISGDGNSVAFVSDSSNFHPDVVFGSRGAFVKDLVTRSLYLASRESGRDGAVHPVDALVMGLSRNGRRVLIYATGSLDPSDPGTGYRLYVRDLDTHETILASRADGPSGARAVGAIFEAALSADGRSVAFQFYGNNIDPADTDSVPDIFVRDLVAGTTRLVSRATGVSGAKGNQESHVGGISEDGSRVLFLSQATNFGFAPPGTGAAFAYLRDVGAGTTVLVSRGPGLAGPPADSTTVSATLSADARYVVLSSPATNLHPDDLDSQYDVVVRDLLSGEMDLVSRASGDHGVKAIGGASGGRISADGRIVAFESAAGNLVPGDTNSARDIFLRDRATAATIRVSVRTFGSQIGYECFQFTMSEDGSAAVFSSLAPDIVDDDTNGYYDLFIRRPLR